MEDYGEFETEDGTVLLFKKNSQVSMMFNSLQSLLDVASDLYENLKHSETQILKRNNTKE